MATYRIQGCDGEKLVLKCPPRTQILIETSFYGRLIPSAELCPASEGAKGKKKKPKAPQDLYEDLSCDVSNANLVCCEVELALLFPQVYEAERFLTLSKQHCYDEC